MAGQFEAVIFDFGGVITTSPFEAFRRYEEKEGLPPGFIRRVNASNPDTNGWARLERAEIDAETFDGLFRAESAALGHPVSGAEVLRLLAGDVRPAMVAALDRLRSLGLRLGCITNNAPVGEGAGMAEAGSARARAVAEALGRFDHVIESSRVGIRKPDPRIYAMMLEALGVLPGRAVFLDDLGINCKPAAIMGLATIKVISEAQALADLGQCLAIDFAQEGQG